MKTDSTQNKKDALWICASLAATLAAMLALSPYDLAISFFFKPSWGGALGEFVQNWGRKPAVILILAAGIILAHHPARRKYKTLSRASAALSAQLILHAALINNAAKLIFGRTRPIRLGESGEGFACFYAVSPGLGDFSFPSGHVAVAMILTPCALLLWRANKRAASASLWLATLAWGGFVAYGRVTFGAHFITDVVFSIGLGIAMAPVSIRLGDAALRKFND